MKICIALHQCMDLGGIINHTEQLAGGLQDLGHTVHLRELVYADNTHDQRRDGFFETGPTGIPFNQGKGWNFGKMQRLRYKKWADLKSVVQILNGYDIVIWTVPVPPKNKLNLGNDKWPELYNLDSSVKQIAFIHDGNIKSGAPHILHIQDNLTAVACVHGCAMNGAGHLTVPRALVLNPQENPVRPIVSWADKQYGFVNMQTFKAWKHVHELVEAIAWMPRKYQNELREVAGRGIEYQYMTSEDKCKPDYFHPENDETFSGLRIWDAALDNGMTHHDYWGTEEVDKWLTRARVLVDPSWSNKYSKVGGHWNRVVIDAMIRGCIPLAQRRGMGDEIFVAGQHYVDLGLANSPYEYGQIILEISNLPAAVAKSIIEEGRQLLPYFDRKNVADQIIRLAHGEGQVAVGKDDPDIRNKMSDLMFNHYGILA